MSEQSCFHCGQIIKWQRRYEGWEGCSQGYWFSVSTGSACPKSEYGHERILTLPAVGMSEQTAREFILAKQKAGIDYGYFKPLQDSHIEYAVSAVAAATKQLQAENEVLVRASSVPARQLAELHLRNEKRLSMRIKELEAAEAKVRELTVQAGKLCAIVTRLLAIHTTSDRMDDAQAISLSEFRELDGIDAALARKETPSK